MKTALFFGATSSIAQATIMKFAEQNYNLILVGRSYSKINEIKLDLIVRYPDINITLYIFEPSEFHSHKDLINKIFNKHNIIDFILFAHGSLPDQSQIMNDHISIVKLFEINTLSIMSYITLLVPYLKVQNFGTIAVISSVAGDRGRQSNFVYGATKASLDAFLQGLRNLLFNNNINIITIKPGFVNTPMTLHLKKNFLFTEPDVIADGIIKAFEEKKDIVYLPKYWQLIMCIIKIIPESIFKRLKL